MGRPSVHPAALPRKPRWRLRRRREKPQRGCARRPPPRGLDLARTATAAHRAPDRCRKSARARGDGRRYVYFSERLPPPRVDSPPGGSCPVRDGRGSAQAGGIAPCTRRPKANVTGPGIGGGHLQDEPAPQLLERLRRRPVVMRTRGGISAREKVRIRADAIVPDDECGRPATSRRDPAPSRGAEDAARNSLLRQKFRLRRGRPHGTTAREPRQGGGEAKSCELDCKACAV